METKIGAAQWARGLGRLSLIEGNAEFNDYRRMPTVTRRSVRVVRQIATSVCM